MYNNIYYVLLFVFTCFFLLGVCLSVFQVELFAAFLWLVECSVIFVFLLLLFYLNIKGIYKQTKTKPYLYLYTICIFFVLVLLGGNSVIDSFMVFENMSIFFIIDNYYEALFNNVQNDLFGFSISYYLLNVVEFVVIGTLLLIGSVICVNLYQFSKKVRVQNYNSFITLFSFFSEVGNFFFLRKQNLTKQGNTKATVKVYKK